MSTRADVDVVDEPEHLDAEWLGAVLRGAGRDVVVTQVTREPVGTGQMGVSYRLRPTYAGDDRGLPASFVAKLPSADRSVRPMVAGAYHTEVVFYREVAPTVAIATPACHHAAITDDHCSFVLLLEDLHPATQGDQLVGATVAEAEASVANLAGLHGPRWCDERLFDIEGITSIDAEGASLLGEVMQAAVPQFVERFGERLAPGDAPLLAEVGDAMTRWIVGRPERFGLVHGDYRMDNLMFRPGAAAGDPAVSTVDWQTLGTGLPARDLAYFLGTSLEPDARRAHEDALVAVYHGALGTHGVDAYSLGTCRDDYRYAALQGPLITVLGAAYGTRTERGDEMFLAMITRSCAAIRDLATLDLL